MAGQTESCSGSGLSSSTASMSISPHSISNRCTARGLRPHIRSDSRRGGRFMSPRVLPMLQYRVARLEIVETATCWYRAEAGACSEIRENRLEIAATFAVPVGLAGRSGASPGSSTPRRCETSLSHSCSHRPAQEGGVVAHRGQLFPAPRAASRTAQHSCLASCRWWRRVLSAVAVVCSSAVARARCASLPEVARSAEARCILYQASLLHTQLLSHVTRRRQPLAGACTYTHIHISHSLQIYYMPFVC